MQSYVPKHGLEKVTHLRLATAHNAEIKAFSPAQTLQKAQREAQGQQPSPGENEKDLPVKIFTYLLRRPGAFVAGPAMIGAGTVSRQGWLGPLEESWGVLIIKSVSRSSYTPKPYAIYTGLHIGQPWLQSQVAACE